MKNRLNELVPSGRWEIQTFTYQSMRCECCGRPITHVFHLVNSDHELHENDESYSLKKVIRVGFVCGPKIFRMSTESFYDDPEAEWIRQHAFVKELISYTVLCVKGLEMWEKEVPKALRESVDSFLSMLPDGDSGTWWRVRNAKKHVLRARKGKGAYNAKNVAKRVAKLQETWSTYCE